MPVLLRLNLPEQTVQCEAHSFSFTLADHHKQNLLKRVVKIGRTLLDDAATRAYENAQERPTL